MLRSIWFDAVFNNQIRLKYGFLLLGSGLARNILSMRHDGFEVSEQ